MACWLSKFCDWHISKLKHFFLFVIATASFLRLKIGPFLQKSQNNDKWSSQNTWFTHLYLIPEYFIGLLYSDCNNVQMKRRNWQKIKVNKFTN